MDRTYLVNLVLASRNENRDDHVHVESAEKVVDAYIKDHPVKGIDETTPVHEDEPDEPSTPEPTPETPSEPSEPEEPKTPADPETPAPEQPEEPEHEDSTGTIDMYNPTDQVDRYVEQFPKLKILADTPNFKWFTGGKNVWADTKDLVTKANGQRVGIVLYAIPGRDNGNYSAGGLESKEAYYNYLGAMADAIGEAPVDIVVEPDALGLSTNLDSDSKKQDRYDMLASAISTLKAKPNVRVYLDASMWHAPDQQWQLLQKIWNFDLVDGTSLNTSGFKIQGDVDKYAVELKKHTNKPSVSDTSRNGVGEWDAPEGTQDPWCNPPGRKIGDFPRFIPDGDAVVAHYWVKAPGESDGTARGGNVPAGEFMPEYAVGLVS